jgi:hypothetical protein
MAEGADELTTTGYQHVDEISLAFPSNPPKEIVV